MAQGGGYENAEPLGAPKIQVTLNDIEEELGPLLTRKEAILTDVNRPKIIGRWILEEKVQLLGLIDVTETTIMDEPPHIKIMCEKDIRYRVCIRLLRMFDTNRKTIGLTSFRASITEYRNDLEDLEMYLVEYFHPSVRGRDDSATMTKTRGQQDRADRNEEGDQNKGQGYSNEGIYSTPLRQPGGGS